MPIYYPDILQQSTPPRVFSYGDREVMLYALSLGLGADPFDHKGVAFSYEKELKVLPSALTVLADEVRNGVSAEVPRGLRISSWNFLRMLHGEQKIEIHKPLPTAGEFITRSRVVGAFDKGPDKGALVVTETYWEDREGQRVATLTNTLFCRDDGGFGGPARGALIPHQRPERSPDLSLDFETRADQALLYRLNGDRNPLHVDPDVATRAGFPAPILHGLCTYGITCRAVVEGMLDYDTAAIRSHEARFSAPMYPGETLTVDLWRDGEVISFEARIKARDVYVIRNGKTSLQTNYIITHIDV